MSTTSCVLKKTKNADESVSPSTDVVRQVRALRDVTPQKLSKALSFIESRIAGDAFLNYQKNTQAARSAKDQQQPFLSSRHNSSLGFQNNQVSCQRDQSPLQSKDYPPSFSRTPLPGQSINDLISSVNSSVPGDRPHSLLKTRKAPSSEEQPSKVDLQKCHNQSESSGLSSCLSGSFSAKKENRKSIPRKRILQKQEKRSKATHDLSNSNTKLIQSAQTSKVSSPRKVFEEPQPPVQDSMVSPPLMFPDFSEFQKLKKSYQTRLMQIECENATTKREQKRKQIHQKLWLYGRPISTLGFNEWQGGELQRTLRVKLDKAQSELELVANSKKKGQKLSVELQLKYQMLQRSLSRYQQQMVKIQEQRENFFFEWRRFHQEETSHYLKDISYTLNYPTLDNGRYLLLSLLGKGGFSEVYYGYDLEKNRKLALKFHNISESWTPHQKESYIKHAMRESATHAKMNHRHIVKCYGSVFLDNSRFFTLLEYCEGCDLLEYLRRNHGRLEEREAKLILAQLLNALKYMSSTEPGREAVIHYDIKPQNILLEEQGNVKIADFGLCKLVNKERGESGVEITSQGVGTYWYLPPETFFSRTENFIPTITQKVDIWSVGVVYFEMLYGVKPFGEGMTPSAIVHQQAILRAKQVIFPDEQKKSPIKQTVENISNLKARSAKVSADAKDFIRNCLKYNETDRYSIEDACNSKYMHDLMALVSK